MYSLVIAEDELTTRWGLVNMVKWNELGFQVDGEFSDGQEVLAYLESHQPDVILTDIKMNHVSGLDSAKFVADRQLPVQVVLLSLTFAVPVLGDTLAFFVGSRVRGPKLCPAVSPNKTISGAIAGLAGSLLAAVVVGLASLLFCDAATLAQLPSWWQYALIGLIGGVAGQMGDLFASLVKRHCGLKDFSSLFPGHGGMLDRLDSILFMAVVMFSFLLLRSAVI